MGAGLTPTTGSPRTDSSGGSCSGQQQSITVLLMSDLHCVRCVCVSVCVSGACVSSCSGSQGRNTEGTESLRPADDLGHGRGAQGEHRGGSLTVASRSTLPPALCSPARVPEKLHACMGPSAEPAVGS